MTSASYKPGPHTATLVDELARLRAGEPVGNALLDLARAGRLEVEHLRRLVGVELQCHIAELTAYGTLIGRFPHRPAAGLFLDVGRLVYDAHPKLRACAFALDIPEERFYRWPTGPAAHAFPGLISWTALHGSLADAAFGLYADLTAYFPGCSELLTQVGALDLKVPEEFAAYYEGGESEEMNDNTLDVVEHGIVHGDDPARALASARTVDEHIGRFWAAAAGSDG
ncbi:MULTISPECIES: hypothetical protein [Actinomadura]|uniref:Transcriptional regulator n=1 Tax=Actinomadura yumaensis TaxID=111807 RepID=A0ABW2CNC4_9ACTN|nr:hypothetical protein [Actinomadura sp. J1-007]MWK36922.1 hypothetical protein [Actinomadura sp. J1-007]